MLTAISIVGWHIKNWAKPRKPKLISKNMKNSLGRNRDPIPSFPLNGEGECRVFMNMLITMNVNLWLCDVMEAHLQFVEDERGRLVRAVMSTVGGSDGEEQK